MWEEVTAISTAVYAGASILLLLSVAAAFLQLRVLNAGQRLARLESFMEGYRTNEMLQHIMSVTDWVREHGRNAPFVYCQMRAQKAPEFEELHNHRRHMSQFLGGLASGTQLGLFSLDFAVKVASSAADDVKFLIGIEWRLRRQLDERDRIFTASTFQRWGMMEMFMASRTARNRRRYGRFVRKTWWTPAAYRQRFAERRFAERDILPRYRHFLQTLAEEEGYAEWAHGALDAFDRPLSPEEQRRETRRFLSRAPISSFVSRLRAIGRGALVLLSGGRWSR